MNRGLHSRQEAAHARLYASDAQISYVRRLLHEAFANLFTHGLRLDPRHLDGLKKGEASRAIELLLAAKRNGWRKEDSGKRDPLQDEEAFLDSIECRGHESFGGPIGAAEYCDGTCRLAGAR